MEKRISVMAAGAVLLLVTAAATGCQETGMSDSSSPPGNRSAYGPSPSASPYSPPSSQPSSADLRESTGNIVKPASINETHSPAGTQSQPEKKKFEPYSAAKPHLMGIGVGDPKSKALSLHGKPIQTYVMDDPDDPITVLDYDGFSIGFNGKDLTEFVEITSEVTEPGLNGLHLGQTADDAVKALGKPDTNTDYVLSYKTKTTVLKLDVDTKTKTIQSIKLFGRNE